MTTIWQPGIAQVTRLGDRCIAWLRVPQPRSSFSDDDADTRRTRSELDAIRARFPDQL